MVDFGNTSKKFQYICNNSDKLSDERILKGGIKND